MAFENMCANGVCVVKKSLDVISNNLILSKHQMYKVQKYEQSSS